MAKEQGLKRGGFDPAEWGLTTKELMEFEYLMNEAFKAGLSAARLPVMSAKTISV